MYTEAQAPERVCRHDRFFVIRQRFYVGLPVCRWAEDHTVVETTDINDVVNVIPSIEGPKDVIYINVRNGTSADVSKTVAVEVSSHVRAGIVDLTDDIRSFIEEHFQPGSLIPAAA